MTEGEIAVFGGAHIDRRGRITGTTAPGSSNPGTWFEEAGGGGFNAARNLARLGHSVRMISTRGGDAAGEMVTAAAAVAGVIDNPLTFLDRQTPSYTAIIENDGNLVIALADMDLYRMFSPRQLQRRALRDAIAESRIVLTDANLPEETIAALVEAASTNGRIVAGIAVSPAKVIRFQPSLAGLSFLFMNEAEARALTGKDSDDAEGWPPLLRAAGLNGGIVTRGGRAVVAFDSETVCVATPPALPKLADVTGAGDAMASGFLAAQLADRDLAECLRYGMAAAGITLRSPLAASEQMSQANLEQALALVPAPQMLA
ncbi:carbohydrate kinase [Ensifer sp. HO-A22]|uniref:Carbohydrate kinase n=1 Tax=Ensifer oleiphilus TaxID=2742698 RepID=A0A7Y6Q3Y3_9HYPH|nr:carbohydrate kinase family protein [Ensifer oleiphilus]NVD38662.1 carbohydrate kinase [Ensifer oleiphilus]